MESIIHFADKTGSEKGIFLPVGTRQVERINT